jgi:hypothetical protein
MHKTLLYIIPIITTFTSWAQSDSIYDISPYAVHDKINFHINAVVAVPLNELREAIKNKFGNVGVGFSTGILANPFGKKKPSPIFVGGDFSYLTYGVDKIDQTVNNPPLKSTFNVYNIHAAGRMLITQDKVFVPYIDGLIGARIFNTRTKIDKDLLDTILNDDQPEVLNTTNDTGLSYGLGLGFYTRRPKNSTEENQVSFTLRILYTWGSEARYVVRDSIEINQDGLIEYQTEQTKTDMLSIQLGIMLY